MVGAVGCELCGPKLVFEDVSGKQYGMERVQSILSMGLYALYDACWRTGLSTLSTWSHLVLSPPAYYQEALEVFQQGADVWSLALGTPAPRDVPCANWDSEVIWWSEPCVLLEPTLAVAGISSSEKDYLSLLDHNGCLEGPDTSVRLSSKDINKWLVAAKNKDDEDDGDDDDDEEDDDEEEDDEEGDEEGPGEGEDEGEEGLAPDDDDDDEDDDDDDGGEEDDEGEKGDEENGKEDSEDEEEEDGVEAEDEEDEEGVDDEGDEEDKDEDDEDDETNEPPKKKRK